MVSVIREVCPEKKGAFENISLSARAVAWPIEELLVYVKEILHDSVNIFQYYSVVLDESTDVSSTVRRYSTISNVCSRYKFRIYYNRQLVTLKGSTTGNDIFDDFLECASKM